MKKYNVISEQGIETTRTDRKDAEEDQRILRFLGKFTTIEETDDDHKLRADKS